MLLNKKMAMIEYSKPVDAVKAVNTNVTLFGDSRITMALTEDAKEGTAEQPHTSPTPAPSKKHQMDTEHVPSKAAHRAAVDEEKGEAPSLMRQNSTTSTDSSKNNIAERNLARLKEQKAKKEVDSQKKALLAKLTEKMKFLLELRMRVTEPGRKNGIMEEMKKVKGTIEEVSKGKHDEGWKEFVEKQGGGFDYSLVFEGIPEDQLNYKALMGKLEV